MSTESRRSRLLVRVGSRQGSAHPLFMRNRLRGGKTGQGHPVAEGKMEVTDSLYSVRRVCVKIRAGRAGSRALSKGRAPSSSRLESGGWGDLHLSCLLQPRGGSTSSLLTISNQGSPHQPNSTAPCPTGRGQFQWPDRGGRSRLAALISG